MQSGLTANQVAERVAAGKVNAPMRTAWTDYSQIVTRHLFTLFNLMVVPAAIALFALHQPQAGLAVSGMMIVNTGVGLFQEIRAKRHLDRLAILVETRVQVLRDGKLETIPAREVVQDDWVSLSPGELVIADGPVLQSSYLEVDEALLTGEAEAVRKNPGDGLLSGSVCMAGTATYRAESVGTAAYAQVISVAARKHHAATSPMTVTLNRIIRYLSLAAIGLCGLFGVLYFLERVNAEQVVLMVAATITSMVPQGLVLTATIAFTVGAVVLGKKGAIVQRLNAVEAMAAIDVICSDKTGTLTTNQLRLNEVQVVADVPAAEVNRLLSLFATVSVDDSNKNIQALRTALGESPGQAIDQQPFQSRHRSSAILIPAEGAKQLLVLGAPETLMSGTGRWSVAAGKMQHAIEKLQQRGLRVMLFADNHIQEDSIASLPEGTELRCLAIVALGDELRTEAGDVIRTLLEQGIAFKVVSGDNPQTVQGTLLATGWKGESLTISGEDVTTPKEWYDRVENYTVFGRIKPNQKVEIIEVLQARGHKVAMIGDGINDVLAIKQANLGIAMGEGTQAAKTVSGIVLENNRFALLPTTLQEGRVIVRNLRRAAKLFLIKNVYSLILIIAYSTGLLGIPFPYLPQQVTLLNWLVIGLPALVIALTRKPSRTPNRSDFLREVGGFALQSGVVFAGAGIGIMLYAGYAWGNDPRLQRTMLLSVLIVLGITALLRAMQDNEAELGTRDWRIYLWAACAIPLYWLAMYVPISARFFDLVELQMHHWVAVGVVALFACVLTCLIDFAYRRPAPAVFGSRTQSAR